MRNKTPNIMVFDDICDENLLDEVYKLHTELGEDKTMFYPFIEKGVFKHTPNKPYESAIKLIKQVEI